MPGESAKPDCMNVSQGSACPEEDRSILADDCFASLPGDVPSKSLDVPASDDTCKGGPSSKDLAPLYDCDRRRKWLGRESSGEMVENGRYIGSVVGVAVEGPATGVEVFWAGGDSSSSSDPSFR